MGLLGLLVLLGYNDITRIMCISHYMIPCSRLCKGYFQAYMVYMGVPKMEVPPNFMKTWTVDCLSMILV